MENLHCKHCGAYWVSRIENPPVQCPRCKNVNWNVDRSDNKKEKLHCKRCGYEWFPRIEKLPTQCPYCKNVKWNIDRNDNKNM